ncbi:MAG: hypothetical protein ACREPQ_12255 [Rhodanobacter sp.]
MRFANLSSWQYLSCIVALWSAALGVSAEDVCKPKNVDVCKIARQFADETASALPIQLNSNLSLQTAFAELSTVSLTAKLNYTREFLNQTLASAGMSNDQMLKVLYNSAKSGICPRSSQSEYFIERGGHVRYIYKFKDGTTSTTVDIDSCT